MRTPYRDCLALDSTVPSEPQSAGGLLIGRVGSRLCSSSKGCWEREVDYSQHEKLPGYRKGVLKMLGGHKCDKYPRQWT